MGVGVSCEEEQLEKKHARGPNRWGTAEPRQDELRDKWLNLKQEEGAEKDGQGIEPQKDTCETDWIRRFLRTPGLRIRRVSGGLSLGLGNLRHA